MATANTENGLTYDEIFDEAGVLAIAVSFDRFKLCKNFLRGSFFRVPIHQRL